MKQSRVWLLIIVAAMLTAACSSGPSKEQSAKAGRMIETAHKARDFNRLLTLSDSLEKQGCLTQAEAYYWKGYASDKMKKNRLAEFYWPEAGMSCFAVRPRASRASRISSFQYPFSLLCPPFT